MRESLSSSSSPKSKLDGERLTATSISTTSLKTEPLLQDLGVVVDDQPEGPRGHNPSYPGFGIKATGHIPELVDSLNARIVHFGEQAPCDVIEPQQLISDVDVSPSPVDYIDVGPDATPGPLHLAEPVDTLDEVVIRFDNPVDHDHIRHSSHPNAKGKRYLTEKEYNILKQRETSLDYYEACTNIYGLKNMGSEPVVPHSEQIFTWIITMCIGVIVGAIGICLRLINTNVSKEKWDVVYRYLAEERYWAAWGSFIGLSLCFAVPSAVIVIFIAPWVGSSGIPDVKTYLNGSNVPRGFAFKTMTLKMASTTLTVLGPIPSGLQGPMIHIGAIIAGWFAQHFRRVVKRVFCCARADQETRDQENRPQYPHPIPAVTFAPGYRTVVDAAFAGIRVECRSSINEQYLNLPKIDEPEVRRAPPLSGDAVADSATTRTANSPAPLTVSSSPFSPPLHCNGPLETSTRVQNHVQNTDSGTSPVCGASLQVLRASTLESIPLIKVALSSSQHLSADTTSPAVSVTSPSVNSASCMSQTTSSKPGLVSLSLDTSCQHDTAGNRCMLGFDTQKDTRIYLDSSCASPPSEATPMDSNSNTPYYHFFTENKATDYADLSSPAIASPYAMKPPENPHSYDSPVSCPIILEQKPSTHASTSNFRTQVQVKPPILPVPPRNGENSSIFLGVGSPLVDATVDGDIVPVTSTGREALMHHAGVILHTHTHKRGNKDLTEEEHEFHKSARIHTKRLQEAQRMLNSCSARVENTPQAVSDHGQVRLQIAENTTTGTEKIEMTAMNGRRAAGLQDVPGNEDPSPGRPPVSEDFSPYYRSDGVKGLAPLPIYVDSERKNHTCPRWLRKIQVPALSTDADRRDFISIGCAAGMSASMGAPIGGVVYVLEEMGSYWSNTLALRLLTGSVLASVTAAFIGTAAARTHRTGEFLPETYATFFVGRRPAAYRVEELPTFIIVGVICGLFGALFNVLSQYMISFRAKVYAKTKLRYALVTLLALIIWATILFVLPFGFDCIKTAPDYAAASALSVGAPADVYSVVRGHCEPGYHNPMSTLTMARFDITAKRLLARGIPNAFEPGVLVVWFLVLFFAIILMSNVASTPGVIMPLLILGAIAGRLVGSGFHQAFGHTDYTISPPSVYFDPGVYATVGAAAMFSGTTRTTLSMSILVLEITSDLNLLLPILIGAFTAHLVSAVLSQPYYEILIRLRRLPFLTANPICELNQLTARQLMAKPVVRLGCVETVSHILDVLESCIHNGFPVILQPCAAQHAQHHHPGCVKSTDPHVHGDDRAVHPLSRSLIDDRDLPYGANSHIGFGCDNTYIGMVLRTHLLAIINRRVWRPDSKPFTPEDFERVLARAPPKISELRMRLTFNDLNAAVDLVPWVNTSAYVVPDSMIGSRVFVLFRQLNLRHLPVVDISRRVVGMITRLELLEPVVKQLYNSLMQRQDEMVAHGDFDWREDWCQHRSALEKMRMAKERQRAVLSNDTDFIKEVPPEGQACVASHACHTLIYVIHCI